MLEPHSFMVVAYLAVGPGLVGHTGMNGVLRHISPLVVSISLTLEPLFGSLLAGRCRLTVSKRVLKVPFVED